MNDDLIYESDQPIRKYHRDVCGKDWGECDCEQKIDEAQAEAIRIVTDNSTATIHHIPGWEMPEEHRKKYSQNREFQKEEK